MNLEQKIMAGLKTAMLARDEKTIRSLRAIKAAIILAKTAEGAAANRGEINEEDEIRMLQKMVKQRKDSLEIFQQQNRTDLAQKELEEIEVIENFLPKQFSADELKAEVSKIIEKIGATSPADMGKVMGAASKQLGGKADGKSIAAAVKELLNK